MLRLAILSLALLPLAAEAPGTAPDEAKKLAAEVDKIFAPMDTTASPGCALGVFQDGRVIYQRGYGMADLDHDVPITPASPFHVASVSKQFTAAAILLLAKDGKLALDDEVQKYVPEVPRFERPITLRQLLHHTSGLRDQWDLLDLAGWRYSLDLITDEDILSVVSRQKALNFPPGERHLYSNTGYTLLAQVVRRVSGQSLREFTEARIFGPLGMASTHFRDDHAEIVKHQALGYQPSPGSSPYRLSVTNFDTVGATSLVTTVLDLARWDENFYEPRVGGADFIRQMLEPGKLEGGKELAYAAGLVAGKYRGLATVEHGGADAGYRADLLRFPGRHFSVAVLCNLATAEPGRLARRVADLYLAKDLEPPSGGAAKAPAAAAVQLPAARLASRAGLYWNGAEEEAVLLLLKGGSLFARLGAQDLELRPTGESTFDVVGLGVSVRFEGAGRSKMGVTFEGSEQERLYEPVSEVKLGAQELAAYAGDYRSAEIDPVYRLAVEGGHLVLKRLKAKPDTLEPLFADTFRGAVGILRFTHTSAGPTGFTLSTGRIRGMRFERSSAVP